MIHGREALKREGYMKYVYEGMTLTSRKGYLCYSMRPRPRSSVAEGMTTWFQWPLLLSNLCLVRRFN